MGDVIAKPEQDPRFELTASGRFLERFGPLGRDAVHSNMKLCVVATDPAFLLDLLYGISLRADCYYVKYGTVARDRMYLGRCMLATDDAVSALCQELKSHPRLMVSLQDDAWFERFRLPPVADGAFDVWDDWEEHAAEVAAVIESAFGQPAEARRVAALRASGAATISLMAQTPPPVRHESWPIVGHVLLSPVTIETAPGTRGLGLWPLAVAPAHQRRGVGKALVDAALRRARLLGYGYVVALGAPLYFSRLGFVPAAELGLSFAKPAAEGTFRVLELMPGALAGAAGVVHYHSAFSH